jgi:hypothetical protein
LLPEKVAQLKFLKNEVRDFLTEMNPLNDDEIDLELILGNVYKGLRSIKFDKLGQQPLPGLAQSEGNQATLDQALKSEPEIECPTCHGVKTVPAGDGEPGICPTCKGAGTVPEKKTTEAPDSVIEQASDILATHNEAETTKEKATPKSEPVYVDKLVLDKILAINSFQSLIAKPPVLRGCFDLDKKTYACIGSVWGKENKEVIPLCYEVVLADEFTGETINTFSAGDVPAAGLKVFYKDKQYVLIGSEIDFLPLQQEPKPQPKKRPRKATAPKEVPVTETETETVK